MAELTLAQAAALVGKSKSTLARAIKSGRLSASREAGGTYRLDPAELLRVYPDAVRDVPHDAPRNGHPVAFDAAAFAAQQAEISALRDDLAKAEQRAAVAEAVADERAAALADARQSLADLRRLLPAAPSASSVRPWWRFFPKS